MVFRMAVTWKIIIDLGGNPGSWSEIHDESRSVTKAPAMMVTGTRADEEIIYSVPFAVTAELTVDSGGGQRLAIRVLNLPIIVPQKINTLLSQFAPYIRMHSTYCTSHG
ncbi:uncharacterized protein LOC110278817 [Arachis duranensis]|uniref:Uncharacterized protein LOC110278817 n=1 Tax=Arachis duranensis TaxID=130453 RepID=A0A9C6TIQ9_ARADU|nr:uncharacterized protein LOC110278817 [Arachis duranensis]XP_052114761.1 uncharacterized protein LOC110278817 [Arachis duranensis]XP_052114763.1 uncharacterized protein LOC110278817 [Arachis duranensis]XP_052114764.1 uncharacterized protein LOC110278817 [Arachis duranensis]XP_052114765.1 uncharacterized protein LOC110278817 [Arachis duranensis]